MPEFVRNAGALAGMMLVLSGCVGGTSPFGGGGDDAATAAPPVAAKKGKEVEAEAPEVFSLTDTALWDGRPSLGGVWVAYRSVTDPERVLIKNNENGKTVKGALFRRERDFPGPSIQMSSDAAAALGILAGQPAKVSIVALRMVAVEPPAPDPKKPAEIETSKIEPAASAAATTAAAAKAEAESKPVARPSDTDKKAAAKPAVKAKTPVTDEKAVAAAAAAAIAKADADKAAKAAAKDDTKKTDTKKTDTKAKAAESAPPAAESGAPLSGVLKQPYIQIGTFSSEENAKRAALQLSKTGLSAVVRKSGEGASVSWRVIVGPALSAAERDALLERVKAGGYPDAFAVGG